MVHNNSIIWKDKNSTILAARKLVERNAIILDTETTGLGEKDEIIEISIIDMKGTVIMDTLIKPTILIPPDALAIHGISNLKVSDAPYISQIFAELTYLLQNNYVVIYNAGFDLRMLQQSLYAHKIEMPNDLKRNVYCAMELYATFNGEWDEGKGSYKWIRLGTAAAELDVPLPDNLHRTKNDAELTRQIVLKIADFRYLP